VAIGYAAYDALDAHNLATLEPPVARWQGTAFAAYASQVSRLELGSH